MELHLRNTYDTCLKPSQNFPHKPNTEYMRKWNRILKMAPIGEDDDDDDDYSGLAITTIISEATCHDDVNYLIDTYEDLKYVLFWYCIL